MAANQSASSLVSRTEGKTLVIERVVNAPKELVFKCFSESEHLANWWGPQGWETKNYTFEFKPGGMWHYCMTCTDKNQGDFFGMESCGIAVYEEIEAPNKFVYKDSFADKEGNVNESMPSMIVTMEFVEYEGKTKIISSTEFVTEEALQQVVDMGVEQGYASQLERLDALLEKLQ
ncbi:SRPBCC domain-containing protein [Fictibacillus aquaticus]|uniref:ATPase n=1 Tax=Fictibacillus aquaticus TaxID=2021314 RepID=A0A235FER1_9BACL|nr:SRPBCC domain-containing protein [Fictibacillus aquaticus]OYD59434.1 ATPase [Fictibacillus aquaticus]